MNVRNLPDTGPVYEDGAEGWYWKFPTDRTWQGPFPNRDAAEDDYQQWAADQSWQSKTGTHNAK